MRSLFIIVLFVAGHRASGQCVFDWIPSDPAPDLGGGEPNVIGRWDPDGAGPLSDVLLAGGNFLLKGDLKALVARWDGSTWNAIGDWPTMSIYGRGTVHAIATLNGDLVAAHNYNVELFGGRAPKARVLRWDGTSWGSLGEVEGSIYGLAEYRGRLVAAGRFQNINGVLARNIAFWDTLNWHQLGNGLYGKDASWVTELIVYDGKLIAAGSFTTAGVVPSANIAKWDDSEWSSLGAGIEGSVWTLTLWGSDLVVGGSFYMAGGQPIGLLAKWDGTTWSAIGPALDESEASITSMTTYEGRLVIGGQIPIVEFKSTHAIARLQENKWEPFGTELEGAAAFALGDFNGKLIASHAYSRIPGSTIQWDGTHWSSLEFGIDSDVRVMVSNGVTWVVGGGFSTVDQVAASLIASWNQATGWMPLGSGLASEHGNEARVDALVFHENDLIAGGIFSTAGGSPVKAVARWDGEQWHAMGTTFEAVNSIAVLQGELFARGDVNQNGVLEGLVARWDGLEWTPLDESLSPQPYLLQVFDNALYGALANGLYRWDDPGWSLIAQSDDYIVAMGRFDGGLVVAGDFATIDGLPFNRIALWKNGSWTALGNGFDDRVFTLGMYNGRLIAGTRWIVAAWDGASWSQFENVGGAFSQVAFGRSLHLGGYYPEPNSYWYQTSFLGELSPQGMLGDFDENEVFDLRDVSDLMACASNPRTRDARATEPPPCFCSFNCDGDADVDLRDFAVLQRAFSP